MMQRRGCKNPFHRREELAILRERQTPHQHRARVDLLMRRLRRKLGKEIHRPISSYPKSEQKAKYLAIPSP